MDYTPCAPTKSLVLMVLYRLLVPFAATCEVYITSVHRSVSHSFVILSIRHSCALLSLS